MFIPPIMKILMIPIGGSKLTFEGLILFLLATPVQFWIGKEFYVQTWKNLKFVKFQGIFLICVTDIKERIWILWLLWERLLRTFIRFCR